MVTVYVKFCGALDLLNDQLRLFHIDPYLYDELKKLMNSSIMNPFNSLIKYENEILYLKRICAWAAALDINFNNVRSDISTTSRDLVVINRRDVLDLGNILIDDIFTLSNQMIVRVQDYDQIAQFLREQFDAYLSKQSSTAFGPITARLARRFIPLFSRHIAQELCTKLNEIANMVLGARINKFDKTFTYDQLYTNSNLVPLTAFSSIAHLFVKFDIPYDENATLNTNLSNLANKCEATVIFVVKINARSTFIEYDDRPLFDSDYVANVATAPFTGLCDTVLARYITFRIIATAADEDIQSNSEITIARNRKHSYVLVIESVDGHNVRIMTHKLRTINTYYTARIDCAYLLDGQSTRSIQYNSTCIHELENHISKQQVANVLNMYMGVDDQEEQIQLSSLIGTRIETFLRMYYSNKIDKNTDEIDIKTIVRAIIPISIWEEAKYMPMLRARYIILATSIAKRIIDMIDHARVDTPANMIAAIMARIDLLELCAENISIYAYLQKQHITAK
jgi:hypothetical protein